MFEFKECLIKGEIVDDLLFEVFVVVCEVVICVFGMCLYGVQLMGGIVLYEGNIFEMKMGEGKMLIFILFVYLNVLIGKGVYVVIVNEYLV